ncbi:MAG: hypothetical protein A2902_04215 [Elusimicrobia bacterium RIFCSPLOWO2_01_FULL_64_13]|nr:MAG: hypothetical protein A2902_04215 [Elusimicrobia bacterium RIFCSPLOWO2_01_FULL_64_13]
MSETEQMSMRMDDAAAQAEAELRKNFKTWSAENIAAWWSVWYLKAGHKRLGRILVRLGREPAKAGKTAQV